MRKFQSRTKLKAKTEENKCYRLKKKKRKQTNRMNGNESKEKQIKITYFIKQRRKRNSKCEK